MTRPEWITPENGPWLCTVHGMLEEAADGSTHCPDCTLAELAEVRGLLREALRKQGTEMVDIAFAREQIARAERAEAALENAKRQADCRYAGAGLADFGGIHCPFGNPCDRCQIEQAEAALADARRALEEVDKEPHDISCSVDLPPGRCCNCFKAPTRAFLAGQEKP